MAQADKERGHQAQGEMLAKVHIALHPSTNNGCADDENGIANCKRDEG
jgi:hypothetical protein